MLQWSRSVAVWFTPSLSGVNSRTPLPPPPPRSTDLCFPCQGHARRCDVVSCGVMPHGVVSVHAGCSAATSGGDATMWSDRRVVLCCAVPFVCCQVLRYNESQAYVVHFDYLEAAEGHNFKSEELGTNRFATVSMDIVWSQRFYLGFLLALPCLPSS